MTWASGLIKIGIRIRHLMLPICPRHLLDDNAAFRAFNSPHCIEKKYGYSPEWDELKPPLTESVIS